MSVLPAKQPSRFQRQAALTLIAVVVTHALLVATHDGEFWPFSIYPMFSQGPAPWQLAVARSLDTPCPDPATCDFDAEALPLLPGRPFDLSPTRLRPQDLAALAAAGGADAEARGTLHTLLRPLLAPGQAVVIYLVDGALTYDEPRRERRLRMTPRPALLVTEREAIPL